MPVHQQPAYREVATAPGGLGETERVARAILSLPMYPHLTDEAVERVIVETRRFFG